MFQTKQVTIGDATILTVEQGPLPPTSIGMWRVTAQTADGKVARFTHYGVITPHVGDTWEMAEPLLLRREVS